MSRSPLLIPLCVVSFACSDKAAMSTRPDASPAATAADLAAEHLADVMNATDAASIADLPPDTRASSDLSVEVVPTPDAPIDMPSLPDLATDHASDLAFDLAPEAAPADACEAVANATYRSTQEHECGLTPTGVASCQWSISFTDNGATRQLSWRLSDYMLSMGYQCNGFTLTGTYGASTGQTYTGTYNPATGILNWDGFDYTKVIR
jgi:hypothetical protein